MTKAADNDEWLTVVPAWGRDYKNHQDVFDAWLTHKDFLIQDVSSRWNGSYVGRSDLSGKPIAVKVRYNQLADYCLLVNDGSNNWTLER